MNQINLPNGCRCSMPQVFPKNWKTAQASVKEPWCIRYRFYDPEKDKPKLVVIKAGINQHTSLRERRNAVTNIIAEELRMLKENGANPISKKMLSNQPVEKNTAVTEALYFALGEVDCEPETRKDIESILRYFSLALRQLGFNDWAVNKITRKEILFTLKQTGKLKGDKWTANNFNHYRKYLMILFAKLVELMAVDNNPVIGIQKKEHAVAIRETLTAAQRKQVDQHLKKKKLLSFRLFIRIFFQSGVRIKEILKLKGNQVNLQQQWFIVTIKKGSKSMQVKKTIRNSALPYWKLIMKYCKKDDLVFGKCLVPGKIKTTAPQITRRWEKHVKAPVDKGGLGFTADFYALKHANSSETTHIYGADAAADQNSHTTTAMVVNIYAPGANKDRKHEELKKVAVSFL